ncbi:MAG TPA: GntR family transcriptional regulator [Actinomycetes bacterium]|nr:GntR family transcriptional regulator [Actinomycetes bacterium]
MVSTPAEAPPRRIRPRLSDEVRDTIVGELLLSGAVPAGSRLPTEAELCRRYGVSRVTVRAALRSLQEAGYIAIRQGQGSTVLPRPQAIPSGLHRLSSLETFAADQGSQVSSAELEVSELALDPDEAARLERPVGTRALVIRRVKVYDDDRVAWIVDYVPAGVLPFAVIEREFAGSVLDVLLAHHELDVEFSDCDVNAVALPADVARRLAVRKGVPAIFLDELTRTSNGEVVNWSQAWILPEFFRFSVRRTRQFRH